MKNIAEHITFLDEQIAAVKKQIQDLIDKHLDLRQHRDLLTTIDGVGDLTAAKVMAEVPDISRCTSASEYKKPLDFQHGISNAGPACQPFTFQNTRSLQSTGRLTQQMDFLRALAPH